MAHFDSLEFPRGVSRGAQSVSERRTDLVELASGRAEVNQLWADSRRAYAAGLGIRSADDLAAVIALWEEARGRANSFRFRDWADFKSCAPSGTPARTDQTIGIGDGVATSFPLVKNYGAINRYVRRITQPVAGSVMVARDGALVSDYSLSPLGVVTFDSAPGNGSVITAGYEFDVPVRFTDDRLSIDLAYFEASGAGIGAAPDVSLTEVRLD